MIIAKSVGSDTDDYYEFNMGHTQNEEIKQLGSMHYLRMVGIRAIGLGVAIV